MVYLSPIHQKSVVGFSHYHTQFLIVLLKKYFIETCPYDSDPPRYFPDLSDHPFSE